MKEVVAATLLLFVTLTSYQNVSAADPSLPSATYTKQLEAEIEMALVYIGELGRCIEKLEKKPPNPKEFETFEQQVRDRLATEIAKSGGNPAPALEHERDVILYIINDLAAAVSQQHGLGEPNPVTSETLRAAIKDEKNRAVPICSGTPSFRSSIQGAVQEGEYTSPNRMFSVRIPKPTGWAAVPYTITPLDTKGDSQYDKVMFHVDDFGTYLVASARLMPAASVPLMDKDDHKTVLRSVSEASLFAWRTDLGALPAIVLESFIDSQYGEVILRVYRAEKGSILAMAQGRRPTRDDAFDTNIASVVARKGPLVVYVFAQNDSSPNNVGALTKMAIDLFFDMKVLPVQ